MITTERKDPIIFDTTLREGFQTPGGIGGSLEERVYVAALIQNYAHWVELGMPANNVEYNFISAIRDRFLQEKFPVGIAVLARCQDLDVERSAEVMSNYTNNLIHLFIGTSEQHRNVRFGGKDEEFYVELISKFVEKASANPIFSRVMFSPEDSYRAWDQNPEAFMRFISAAKNGYERGNKRVGRKDSVIFNLPDTTGASTVERFCQLVERVNTEFGDEVELSIHCHNDSIMSQAQAITVYERYGLRWLQTTFAQLGERNGITPTDTTIKILADNKYLTDPRITSPENLGLLDPTTHAILWTLGRTVPKEHLERTNVSTAGIHTDLVIKDTGTYHIRGTKYGSQISIELGPTSGSKQVIDVLTKNKFSYEGFSKDTLEKFVDRLKSEANRNKFPVSETCILYEAYKEFLGMQDDGLKIDKYDVSTPSDGLTRLIIQGSIDGISFLKDHSSKGPIEAAVEALNYVINGHLGKKSEIKLESYEPRVIPIIGEEYLHWEVGQRPKIPRQMGKDAHLCIGLSLRNGNGLYYGWASHAKSTKAEINAVIDGATKMYAIQKWQGLIKPS